MGKRILMILGGIYHDFEGFAAATRPILEAAGYSVEATYDLDRLVGLTDDDFDLVVSYTSLSRHREGKGDTSPETLTDAQTEGLTQWVRAGGGLLTVHCSTVSGQPNPAMRALLGGVFLNHPPQFVFTVYPMMRAHPITSGIEAFSVRDEFYVQDYDPSVDVHMVAMDRGVAYPMVWSKAEGKGLVAHIAIGHGPSAWDLAAFRRLMVQTASWLTAGAE